MTYWGSKTSRMRAVVATAFFARSPPSSKTLSHLGVKIRSFQTYPSPVILIHWYPHYRSQGPRPKAQGPMANLTQPRLAKKELLNSTTWCSWSWDLSISILSILSILSPHLSSWNKFWNQPTQTQTQLLVFTIISTVRILFRFRNPNSMVVSAISSGFSWFHPFWRKGFAGAAVLYLPRSFLNGGLVLGMVTLETRWRRRVGWVGLGRTQWWTPQNPKWGNSKNHQNHPNIRYLGYHMIPKKLFLEISFFRDILPFLWRKRHETCRAVLPRQQSAFSSQCPWRNSSIA